MAWDHVETCGRHGFLSACYLQIVGWSGFQVRVISKCRMYKKVGAYLWYEKVSTAYGAVTLSSNTPFSFGLARSRDVIAFDPERHMRYPSVQDRAWADMSDMEGGSVTQSAPPTEPDPVSSTALMEYQLVCLCRVPLLSLSHTFPRAANWLSFYYQIAPVWVLRRSCNRVGLTEPPVDLRITNHLFFSSLVFSFGDQQSRE